MSKPSRRAAAIQKQSHFTLQSAREKGGESQSTFFFHASQAQLMRGGRGDDLSEGAVEEQSRQVCAGR